MEVVHMVSGIFMFINHTKIHILFSVEYMVYLTNASPEITHITVIVYKIVLHIHIRIVLIIIAPIYNNNNQ